MAIKYLDAKRLQGTNAERLALTNTPTRQDYRMDSDESSAISSSNINFTSPTGIRGGFTTGYGGDTLTFDIGSALSDTAWITRLELTFTGDTINSNWQSGNGMAVWLSDSATGNVDTSQDYATLIGQYAQNNSGRVGTQMKDGSTPELNYVDGSSPAITSFSSQTYYVETKKVSDVLTARITTETDYTGGDTQEITQADVTGLRYLKFTGFTEYRDSGYGPQYPDGNIAGNIQNLKICDTVTTYDEDDVTYNLTTTLSSLNPSLPNGTIFNETDVFKYFMFDGTDTWNQMVSS